MARQRTKRIVAAAKFVGGPYDGGVKSWPVDWMDKTVKFPVNVDGVCVGQLHFNPREISEKVHHVYERKTRVDSVAGFVIFVYDYVGIVGLG